MARSDKLATQAPVAVVVTFRRLQFCFHSRHNLTCSDGLCRSGLCFPEPTDGTSAQAHPSRVILFGSLGHRLQRGPLRLDDLHYRRRWYQRFLAYGQSKFAAILFATELSRRRGPASWSPPPTAVKILPRAAVLMRRNCSSNASPRDGGGVGRSHSDPTSQFGHVRCLQRGP